MGTSIIGESANFYPLGYNIDGTMTSPAALLRVIEEEYIQYHIWNAVRIVTQHLNAKSLYWHVKAIVRDALEPFFVGAGTLFHDQVQGPHWIQVDPRLHDKQDDMIAQAVNFVDAFQDRGISRDEIIINIPASRDGIYACRKLTSGQGFKVNLSLVSSLSHAQLCLEAGASSISIPVRRVLQFHEKRDLKITVRTRPHPGINTIHLIQAYCKLKRAKSVVICNNLRSLAEIRDVARVDVIALSEFQLEELRHSRIAIAEPIPESSPVYAHASQVEYPTTFLNDFRALRDCMSPGDYEAFCFVLKEGLTAMITDMGSIDAAIQKEVQKRMFYTTAPLETLETLRPRLPAIEMVPAPSPRPLRRRRMSKVSLRESTPEPSEPTEKLRTESKDPQEMIHDSMQRVQSWFQSQSQILPDDMDKPDQDQDQDTATTNRLTDPWDTLEPADGDFEDFEDF
ncbi:aldolase [Neolentinus lepideus HHB14362 ss-1]|uniref:Aldolase n=1 Tax=Neolentinus lepideus HHB14362 ss-1 TaxID=1314782 RepID=A0A165T3G3_9AGAM|nr:aldolase [Neolentinus lepideus HHB14362 ss-1]